MQPLVSVIVPVYGVERFLSDCVESLLAQTLPDIELIFVNDASPDGCLAMLRTYETRFPERVRVIDSPKNLRQGGARNLGICAARADYLGFVDGDDYVHADMFKDLYAKCVGTGADAAFCQYAAVPEHAVHGETQPDTPFIRWKPELLRWDCAALTDEGRMDLIAYPVGGVVCGLWKRSILLDNQLFFPEHLRYEDNYWQALVCCYLQRVAFLPQVRYYYRQNEASTVHQRNQQYQVDDRITIERMLLTDATEKGLYKRFEKAWAYLYTFRYAVVTMDLACYALDAPPVEKLVGVMQDLQTRFPNWETNPYYQAAYTDEEKSRNRKMIEQPQAYIQERLKEKKKAKQKVKRQQALSAAICKGKRLLGLEQYTLSDLLKKK